MAAASVAVVRDFVQQGVTMKHRHVILEGKPTTGKTEVSNLLKIFLPKQVVILPELTTVLVRENKLNILRDRAELTALLLDAVPARKAEVQRIIAAQPGVVVFEESHMGVHWAYATILDDRTFLDIYDEQIAPHVLVPDLFLRLDMPIGLSVRRQKARATKDVEVDGELVRRTFELIDEWHANLGANNLHVLNSNRPPDQFVRAVMDVLGVEYEVFAD